MKLILLLFIFTRNIWFKNILNNIIRGINMEKIINIRLKS